MNQFTHINLAQLSLGAQANLSTQYGVIRATGLDARSFLHAQLTQDVANLAANETKLAAYCNAKGRMFAIFQMAVQGDDVYLITRKDVIEQVVKRLRMFVLRAKVILEDVSEQFQLIGCIGQNCLAQGQAQMNGENQRLGIMPAAIEGQIIAREIVMQPKSSTTATNVSADHIKIDLNAWEWLDIMAGEPHVQASTVEAFVPQMLNLERIGGVNFKKGCYPGQEIVARSHYLGKLKRRTLAVRFTFADDASAQAALPQLSAHTDIHSSSDTSQPAGIIVASALNLLNSNVVDALIEVSLPMLDGDASLHVEGVAAQVMRLELPYTLSDAAE